MALFWFVPDSNNNIKMIRLKQDQGGKLVTYKYKWQKQVNIRTLYILEKLKGKRQIS